MAYYRASLAQLRLRLPPAAAWGFGAYRSPTRFCPMSMDRRSGTLGRGWGPAASPSRADITLRALRSNSSSRFDSGFRSGFGDDLGYSTRTYPDQRRALTGLSSRVFQLAQLPALLGCGRACKCSACSGSSRAQFGSRGEGRCPRASSSHGRSLPVHPHAHTSCSLQVRKAWLPGILHVRAQNPSQVRPLPMSCTLTCLRTQD